MQITAGAVGAALKSAMTQWAVSLPTVAVWITGIIFAFIRWRRSPKVSLPVIVSCGLSLLATLVMPVVMYLAFAMIRSNGPSLPIVSMAVSFVWACLVAVSGGLLIYAAFVDRREGSS
jgi:hypothetical protein